MRFLKRLIYGILYLSLAAWVGAGFYFAFLVPAPSCLDNRQNQLETDIDCGPDVGVSETGPFSAGGCIPCELKKIKASGPSVGEVKIYALSQYTTTLAAEITNPSPNYGLKDLEYTYNIYSSDNFLLRSVRGESSLYPSEKKYLVISGIDIERLRISRAEITLGEIGWVPKDQLPSLPNITLSGEKASESAGSVLVTGNITNNSAVRLGPLQVVTMGYSNYGVISAISSYEVSELQPFSSAEYRIFLPAAKYSSFKTYLEIPPQD